MAITANVTNGKLDKTNTTPTQNRKTSSAKASGSNLGYDDFLKLLSAEMQYQDPLEPTSNTDYVAQMATFSQLEATLSMKESMASSNDQTTKSAALSLVGKEVIVTDKDSASGYYSGKVDYVTYKDGKIQLSINENWIPRTVRQRQRKIDEAIKNIELRTGKTANDADLAKELSISEDELCSWQSQLKVTNVVSLDEFDESGPEPVMDAAHNSHYAQPEEIVTQEELKTMLVKSLDNLTEKERRVIELYYYEDLTLKEISNILEVSESRVSQLHTKGLIKMRKVMGPYMNILTNA